MKAKVVDTIYLTIEPILFGKGMNIFNDELDFKLTLRNVESIKESDSILLEYGVAFS
jgi:riboflavin biosynthesis pyrimidine reductase